MLDALQSPTVIGVIVLVLLVLIAIPVLARRRRAGHDEILPPPDLGQPIDYTSIPIEEPVSPAERFKQASPFVKVLVVLVPLLVIVGGVVLYMTFLGSPSASQATPTPVGPPPEITNVTATVAGRGKIRVRADTTLPNGTSVRVVMREGTQELSWFDSEKVAAQANNGKIELIVDRVQEAPAPQRESGQMIVLSAVVGDQPVTSEPAAVNVPSLYEADYYQIAAATAVPPTPTATATAAPPTAVAAVPTEAPTASPSLTLTATVFNGGNIRRVPQITNNPADVLGQLHAGETVGLLERSDDGTWYRVRAPEAEGWVSRTLLTIDPQVAQQVPRPAPAPTGLEARVFNGGNVRERPVTGRPLDQINAGETVQLLERTADSGWYRITNIRGITGWVSRTLLTIDPQVAQQVPVAR